MKRREKSTPTRPQCGLQLEQLEDRRVLAAFPAYVDGAFTFGSSTAAAPYGIDNTFLLESLPGADKTIYIDFDGHFSTNNSWGHSINFPAFSRDGNTGSFSTTEHNEMQQTFQNVAEDFLPFGVNVTTKDPGAAALIRTNGADAEYGVRALATQATNGFGNGIGGVAFLNSFNDSVDNPVFVFNKGARNGGMTVSHEVGHALGLSHDGLNNQTYHPGSGNGSTGWGPIMGAPFGKVVTQWSNGDYAGSTTTQNDLNVITKPANGFTFRTDDFGSTQSTSEVLTPDAGVISEWGIIERNTDVDFFEFTTGAGAVSIDIDTFAQDSNLDVLAKIYDSSGTVIAESEPINSRDAFFDLNLDAGTYSLSVEGTGRADGRYSDYGSLGLYTVEGTVVESTSVIDGDFNDDGNWDGVDIDLLVQDIVGTGTAAEFDLTGDGIVDNLDRDAWLAEAGGINLANGNPYLLGDLTLNGVVDGEDFLGWNDFKFTSDSAWTHGDFNADGDVDGLDFLIWNDFKFTESDAVANSGNSISATDNVWNYVDPYGDAPAWPLGQNGHDHDEFDHDHDEHDFDHDHDHGHEHDELDNVAFVSDVTVRSEATSTRAADATANQGGDELSSTSKLGARQQHVVESFGSTRSVRSHQIPATHVDAAIELL